MNARVLLAEDHQNLAQLLGRFLQNAGHEAVIAATGRETIQQLANGSFDLLILDLNLPEMSGVELLQKLRKSPRMGSLPVIIITGAYKGDKYSQAALKLGVRHYLEKPFTKEEFAAAVADTIAAIEASRRKPELLQMLITIYSNRQSGVLKIDGASPVIFVKGEPCSFLPAGKRDFPALLFARGKITREEMQKFLDSN